MSLAVNTAKGFVALPGGSGGASDPTLDQINALYEDFELLNGFGTNVGAGDPKACARLEPGQVVRLQGSFQLAGALTAGQTICTLPDAKYFPPEIRTVLTRTVGNSLQDLLRVNTNGVINVVSAGATTSSDVLWIDTTYSLIASPA